MKLNLTRLLPILAFCASLLPSPATARDLSTPAARDAVRKMQIEHIGGLLQGKTIASTYSYGEAEVAGWDTSVLDRNRDGNRWLDFLGLQPVDPLNDGDPKIPFWETPKKGRQNMYYYYCYTATRDQADGMRLWGHEGTHDYAVVAANLESGDVFYVRVDTVTCQ